MLLEFLEESNRGEFIESGVKLPVRDDRECRTRRQTVSEREFLTDDSATRQRRILRMDERKSR